MYTDPIKMKSIKEIDIKLSLNGISEKSWDFCLDF